jgi:purine-binding chemotaxis protein CheW
MTALSVPAFAAMLDGPAGAVTMVTFQLGGQMMALPARTVREILDPVPVTRVPGADPLAPSVANIRGAIVPVIRLGTALGLNDDTDAPSRRTMVLDTDLHGEASMVAILAEAVHEVVQIAPEDIAPVTAFSGPWPPGLLTGLCRRGTRFVLLPDIDAILSTRIVPPLPGPTAPAFSVS